jgi:hypothetical protein
LGPACKQHVGIAFPRFFFRSSRGASGSSAGLEWQIVAHNEFEGLVRPTEGPELSDDERRNGRGGAGGEAAAAGERPHRGAPPRPEPRAGRLRGRLRHHDPALRRRLRPHRPPPPPRRQGYPLPSPPFLLPWDFFFPCLNPRYWFARASRRSGEEQFPCSTPLLVTAEVCPR